MPLTADYDVYPSDRVEQSRANMQHVLNQGSITMQHVAYMLSVMAGDILTMVECGLMDALVDFFTSGKVAARMIDDDICEYDSGISAAFGFYTSNTRSTICRQMLQKLGAFTRYYKIKNPINKDNLCQFISSEIVQSFESREHSTAFRFSLIPFQIPSDADIAILMKPHIISAVLDKYVPLLMLPISRGITDALYDFYGTMVSSRFADQVKLSNIAPVWRHATPFNSNSVKHIAYDVMMHKLVKFAKLLSKAP